MKNDRPQQGPDHLRPMTILNFGNTAIVVERIVAVQCDEPFSGDEAVRVHMSGLIHPIELFVEDPEKTYLQICAAIAALSASGRSDANSSVVN